MRTFGLRRGVLTQTRLEQSNRHSRRVDRLRFMLPAAALLLLAVVVAWPWITGGYHGLIVPVFKTMGDQANDAMRMAKPRYVGRTKAQEPYEVTASSAFLDPTNPNRIHLDELHAVLERGGTSDVRLRADEGIYLRGEDRLNLGGNLELTFGQGYRFNTAKAEVDLGRGHVTGRTPVTGEGPVGALSADEFDIEDGGRRLRFKGRVRVTILPEDPST
jgi:lipopolysaccharide export system protein LptC